MEVNKRIAEQLSCLGRTEWPKDLEPIQASYDGEFGMVEFWEEESKISQEFLFGESKGGDVEVLSPYMKVWVFPPKEFVKEEFITSMEKGEMPGPSEEKAKGPGLTKEQINQIRNDPGAMERVRELSERFGGEARFKVFFVDGEEKVGEVLVVINEEDIGIIDPGFDTSNEELDGKMFIDFDFMYEFIAFEEKENSGTRVESPPWEGRRGGIIEVVKNVKNEAATISKGIGGLRSGKIRTEPKMGAWETLRLIGDVASIFGQGGGHEGPPPDEE